MVRARFFIKQFWPSPSPFNKKLIPALPPNVRVDKEPKNFAELYLKHKTGRLLIMGKHITELVKYERITLAHHRAQEVQGYVERLITDAIRFGDRHIPTMELADFYIHEKQLIHKLFKVLVPRYINYTESFTKLWILSNPKDSNSVKKGVRWFDRGVLELKGNPLPPIEPPKHASRKHYLTNVLLDAAKKDYYHSKKDKNESNNQ